MESARWAELKETAALWQLNSALREAEFGNAERARQEAKLGLTTASTRDVQALAALVLARIGDAPRAKSLSKELEKQFPAIPLSTTTGCPVLRKNSVQGYAATFSSQYS